MRFGDDTVSIVKGNVTVNGKKVIHPSDQTVSEQLVGDLTVKFTHDGTKVEVGDAQGNRITSHHHATADATAAVLLLFPVGYWQNVRRVAARRGCA